MSDHLVTLVNIPVFGDSPGYRLEYIDEHKLAKWAIEVKQLLKAHSKLAEEKLLPRDSITEAAVKAMWGCYPALAEVPSSYENEAMANATIHLLSA